MRRRRVRAFLTIDTLSVKTELLRRNNIRLHEGIFYVDLQYVVMATRYAATVQFAPVEVYQYLLGNAEQSVAFASYAKRYEDHAAMVRDILAFADEGRFAGAHRAVPGQSRAAGAAHALQHRAYLR